MKKLTTEEIEQLVGQMIDDAERFVEEELSPAREKATKYYKREKYGNEEEGRSQVVTAEVRDTVQGVLPSLMRIFVGSEKVVEFNPRDANDIPEAEQKTDYTNFVFMQDNPGYVTLYNAVTDGLVRRLGFVKWWPEKKKVRKELSYSGISEAELEVLLTDESLDVTVTEEGETELGPVFDVHVVKDVVERRCRVASVPPEEILWNRTARALDNALIVVHSREVMVSDLVSMDFDEDVDDLLEMARPKSKDERSSEVRARRFDNSDDDENTFDPATTPIRFDEAYALLDRTGEGVVGLYKVSMASDSHNILHRNGKPCIDGQDHLPIACFSPFLEPHTVVGESMADQTEDLQLINSSITRGTLDSLSMTLVPRTEVVPDIVNLADVLNPEVGGVIRSKAIGHMREVSHRFVGTEALQVLQHFEHIKEKRTGIGKAFMGLDADALQSTTKAGVNATISAAQMKIEFIARNFAETGLKPMFEGIAKTLKAHQDDVRVVRLRNTFVEVDPRSWNDNMDTSINVALGTGGVEEKIAVLEGVAQKQSQILQTLGPNNPIVGLAEYRTTLAKMVELAGWKNSNDFFKPFTAQEEQALNANQQPPPPDPAIEKAAQIEQAKIQLEAQKNQAELELKRQELLLKREMMELQDDRERDKAAADLSVRITEIEVKNSTSLERQKIAAQTQEMRALLQAETQVTTEAMRQSDG